MECAFHFLSFSVQNSRKIGLDKGVHCSNVAPLIVAREKILRYCYHIVVYVFYLLISYERLEVFMGGWGSGSSGGFGKRN